MSVRRVRLVGRGRRSRRAFVAGALLGLLIGFMLAWFLAPERSAAPTLSSSVRHRGLQDSGSPTLRFRPPRLPMIVDVTAYSLEVAQTDATPFISRCGRIAPAGVPAGDGRYLPAVAVSRDLLRLADCGARVRVNGREYVVWDTMSTRWTRRVDVLAASRGDAIRRGIRPGMFEVVRQWPERRREMKCGMKGPSSTARRDWDFDEGTRLRAEQVESALAVAVDHIR